MPRAHSEDEQAFDGTQSNSKRRKPFTTRRRLFVGGIAVGLASGVLGYAAWISSTASLIQSELEAATSIAPDLRGKLSSGSAQAAQEDVARLRAHTGKAKDAADQPLWILACNVPLIGANFAAVSEVARSADDVANLALAPLVNVFASLSWDSLLPKSSGADLKPLIAASPTVSSAAHAVRTSSARLEAIDTNGLLPRVAEPLAGAAAQLEDVASTLDAAADAAQVVPGMLGANSQRQYLLMIQNNAESRASGGIPGALAVLKINSGKLSLGEQSSAGEIGTMTPTLQLDAEQQLIYSSRLGKFMQDVNLTPDFPSAARTAQEMWERKTGGRVDGVISIDPIALGYVLDATGPVKLGSPELASLSGGLPTELDANNVVRTLLSDVYAKIPNPTLQDAYFAGVAQETFAALADGRGDAKALIAGLARGTEEGRVLVWSADNAEQSVIERYPLSGSIAGPSTSPAQFGVYFNDGTGAKMDYHMKRTVQLVEECPAGGYSQMKVRVTSTNTAPKDAATSLPDYVTGGGAFGVPAGTVQTNVIAYGPVQSNVETVFVAGKKTGFASNRHSGRPVGSVTVRLAPGESSTVDFTFDKIVQHTEPKLSVTPTVQPLNDVVLDTMKAKCAPAA